MEREAVSERETENDKTIEQAQIQNIYNRFNDLFSPISTENLRLQSLRCYGSDQI